MHLERNHSAGIPDSIGMQGMAAGALGGYPTRRLKDSRIRFQNILPEMTPIAQTLGSCLAKLAVYHSDARIEKLKA